MVSHCLIDGSGELNFMEFVCSMWHFLTLEENEFGELAFMIMDPTASKSLNGNTYCDIVYNSCF